MLVAIDTARKLVENSMVAVGHTLVEGEIIADHIIDCELRTVSFGGLSRALSVIDRIQTCDMQPQGISVLKETPTSVSLDGGGKVGYLVGHRATQIAIDKASSNGLAVVGAHNTWYTGMFSYYLEMVTKAGFAGMVAGSSGTLVAPHGGSEARFGTNPIAFGFPSSNGPVIWDIGTSGLMLGETVLRQRLGEPLPQGSAFDSGGNPTRDPSAALDGALAVWGGHKGSGLALVIHLLGMMSGGDAHPRSLAECAFFGLVIDPGLLTSGDDFPQRVADYADSVRETRPLNPGAPVRIPFDRSRAERARRQDDNTIDVSDEIYAELLRIGGTTPNG